MFMAHQSRQVPSPVSTFEGVSEASLHIGGCGCSMFDMPTACYEWLLSETSMSGLCEADYQNDVLCGNPGSIC